MGQLQVKMHKWTITLLRLIRRQIKVTPHMLLRHNSLVPLERDPPEG